MTDTTDNKSKMLTVKTGYARIALMLMAANLLLTGYAIAALTNLQTASITDEPVTETTTPTSTPTTAEEN
jgi:hypothetical protein